MNSKIKALILVAVGLLLGFPFISYAAGTSSSSWESSEKNGPVVSLYDQGVEATKNNDFKEAFRLFTLALQQDKNNPDILNMLAHTQLKLGMIDESLASYKNALNLRPKFPEAREYLGEAYIQAALREIKTLKSYGGEGAESLDDLIKAFKEAVASLE